MLRSSLIAASAVVLCATSSAQQQISAQKVISPVRDAGTFHVTTNTWTRTGSSANLGSDVIYSATAPSGYFGTGWEGNLGVDEGIVPGTGAGGTQDAYVINCFDWSYCSQADTLDWSWQFLPSFVPCDLYGADAANCQVAAPGYLITGLPTAGGCWIVTIDLTGAETCLEADGGSCAPGYQGGGLGLDHFGIAHIWATGNGGFTGPILEGHDPNWAPAGEGTCYNPAATCVAGNTALGSQDFFTIDEGNIGPGCYFFGGYTNTNGCGGPSQGPPAQFSMNLFTDCAITCDPSTECGTVYCDTNADNDGDISIDTCAVDGGPGNTLSVDNHPTGLFGYFLISATQGSIVNPPGATGELCVGPAGIGRYNSDLDVYSGGTIITDIYNSVSGGGGGGIPTLGGTLTAGDTWNFQAWSRVGGGSDFSSAIEVTFE